MSIPSEPVASRVPGFVPADAPDAGAAAHFGSPTAEQRSLVSGRAVADLSSRGVVRLTGPDRLTWLDSLTSQRVANLAPGESAEDLILDPQGRVEHALHVVDDGEATWLVTEAGDAPAVQAWLDSMRFMMRVDVRDVSAEFAVLGAWGRGAELPGAVVTWTDPWPHASGMSRAYADLDVTWDFTEVVVRRADLATATADRVWAGVLAVEALRVAALRPRQATEVDARTVPHELDWLRTAVHLSKGCYRGQETVARVNNLGRPPRRIVLLQLDGSGHELPAAGASVTAGERVVGRITTPALHHEEGPLALAVVKVSADLTQPLATVDRSGDPVAAAVDDRQREETFSARPERPRLG